MCNPHSPPYVGRRQFVRAVSMAAAGGLLLPSNAWASSTPSTGCELTRGDIEGPYYRPGAPFITALAGPREPGQPVVIRGRVLRSDCRTPVNGAIVDVWQANHSGRYDNMDPRAPVDPTVFLLRGQMRTNADGAYEFTSVLPGRYSLGRERYRPAHIHYKVFSPEGGELTTQIYFQDDPYLAVDPWAQRAEQARILGLEPADGVAAGTFDVIL